ncbi:MAG: iron-sulfur cluster-binding protein, partial [Acidobacteria bacterium]
MTSRVAILRVTPETILSDVDRLVDLAGVSVALDSSKTTILKDNISWHFPFPAANTTPWQLEGTIQALARRGFADQVCVQNKTVVTNAFKGEDLNHYVPIVKRYGIPVLYNFVEKDMTWVSYEPKAPMRVLKRIYPEGIHIP